MKKKILAFLLGTVMVFTMAIPALAATESFSLGGVSGSVSLTKGTSSATGKTSYGIGRQVTANRTVSVTLTCTKGGQTYTYSDKKTASTNAGNYSSTTASLTVYRPSDNYTVKSAKSSHSVTTSGGSFNRSLSV